MGVRDGVDWELERFADMILDEDRRAYYARVRRCGSQYLVHGILSKDQWELRREREILTAQGNFDVVREAGVYSRAWWDRPHRPTCRRRWSLEQDPWRQDCFESGHSPTTGVWVPIATRDEVTGGYLFDWGLRTDPAWPRSGNNRDVGFLDRFQRSRIRAAMRKVPADKPDVKSLLRDVLAAHYGVPTWMIARIVGPPN